MSETKHTKGPWNVWDRGNLPPIINGDGSQICICTSTETRGMIETQEQMYANAQLIAAAPALLAHLKMAVELRHLEEERGQIVNWPKWFDEAKAAIALAEKGE